MKLRVYTTRAEAEAAQRALDAAAGVPRTHAEGAGRDDYRIATPGNAASRIRARGVRTEHVVELIANKDGSAFALRDERDRAAVETAPETWFGPLTHEVPR